MKQVLLFSSGMDSYIINQLEQPQVLLFINNRSKYASVERRFLKKQKYKHLIMLEDFINMRCFEREDSLIPLRNLFFIATASLYGDEILLGATAGDRIRDKDETFAGMMEKVLHYLHNDYYAEPRSISVNFKYKNYTKSELVGLLLSKRMKMEKKLNGEEMFDFSPGVKYKLARELRDKSFSCYSPGLRDEPCCECKACVRKFLGIYSALEVSISKRYEDCWTEERLEKFFKEEGMKRGREDREMIGAAKKLLEAQREGTILRLEDK
jgi:7-cyano-7-deazaguanine synthase in queuosine biosynthesis